MLFNSWEFLFLLITTFAIYYLPELLGWQSRSWQVVIALMASVVFYGSDNPSLLILLGFSCVGNAFAAAKIIFHKCAGDQRKVAHWVKLSVTTNLLLLGFFKYLTLIAESLPCLPVHWVSFAKTIPLPIGISFYTFHAISMLIDISREEVNREGNGVLSRGTSLTTGVRDIAFYLLFFPQLVAGPIVKAKQFWPQIAFKRFKDIPWVHVTKSLILGFFLKMVVADNLAEQTIVLTKPWITELSPISLIALLYGYSFQIFADFAGYSLIAIGLASMFGYRFPINFDFPYLSTSITEFWRRWHMSLSAWLRDYLYIPLGGNRLGEARTYINLFLVMFLGGLWHGAELKFALWGTLHGILLAIERLCSRKKSRNANRSSLSVFLCWFYAFHAVTLLWLTFLMPDVDQILLFFRELFIPGRINGPAVFVSAFFGMYVVLYHLNAYVRDHHTSFHGRLFTPQISAMSYAFMLFMIVVNSGAPGGFIYFQF